MSKKTHKKTGIGIVKTNLKQLLISKNFYFAIFALSATLIFIYFRHIHSGGAINYKDFLFEGGVCYITIRVFDYNVVSNLIILIATLPVATSFCTEWNTRYVRSIVSRTGAGKFARHKVLTCYFGTFTAIFIAMAIFTVILLALKAPIIDEVGINNAREPFGAIVENHPYLYQLIHIICFSSYCAFWSIVGLAVSAYIPNQYIVYAAPFILYFIVDLQLYKSFWQIKFFPNWLILPNLAHITTVGKLTGNLWIDFFYIVSLFLGLGLLTGELFVYGVKRRMRDEMA